MLQTNCKTNLFLFSSFQLGPTRSKDWPKMTLKSRVALLWLGVKDQTNTKLTESSSTCIAYRSFLYIYDLRQTVFNGSFLSTIWENQIKFGLFSVTSLHQTEIWPTGPYCVHVSIL